MAFGRSRLVLPAAAASALAAWVSHAAWLRSLESPSILRQVKSEVAEEASVGHQGQVLASVLGSANALVLSGSDSTLVMNSALNLAKLPYFRADPETSLRDNLLRFQMPVGPARAWLLSIFGEVAGDPLATAFQQLCSGPRGVVWLSQAHFEEEPEWSLAVASSSNVLLCVEARSSPFAGEQCARFIRKNGIKTRHRHCPLPRSQAACEARIAKALDLADPSCGTDDEREAAQLRRRIVREVGVHPDEIERLRAVLHDKDCSDAALSAAIEKAMERRTSDLRLAFLADSGDPVPFRFEVGLWELLMELAGDDLSPSLGLVESVGTNNVIEVTFSALFERQICASSDDASSESLDAAVSFAEHWSQEGWLHVDAAKHGSCDDDDVDGAEAEDWQTVLRVEPLTLAAFRFLSRTDTALRETMEGRLRREHHRQDCCRAASDVLALNVVIDNFEHWRTSSRIALDTIEDEEERDVQATLLAIEEDSRMRSIWVQCAELVRRAEILGIAPKILLAERNNRGQHFCFSRDQKTKTLK